MAKYDPKVRPFWEVVRGGGPISAHMAAHEHAAAIRDKRRREQEEKIAEMKLHRKERAQKVRTEKIEREESYLSLVVGGEE